MFTEIFLMNVGGSVQRPVSPWRNQYIEICQQLENVFEITVLTKGHNDRWVYALHPSHISAFLIACVQAFSLCSRIIAVLKKRCGFEKAMRF